ncbi:fumarylacetoacetate hydrolase family protein [Streptomyces cyaneofuscatus]|uniref:fumarylacetoacetate hydrolase family protein n=1 Tax=Streptomyces cyaneofuscatus TaxID=66883 RepID=UPI003325E755
MQDGSIATMIFSVAELVAYCSTFITLVPGDIILTGAPAACGDFQTPKIALHPGDVLEVEVTDLGRQRSAITAPAQPGP